MSTTRYVGLWEDASVYAKSDQFLTGEDLEALTRLYRGETHGLHFEKLKTSKRNIWSIRTDKKRRILLEIDGEMIFVLRVMEDHKYSRALKQEANSSKSEKVIDTEGGDHPEWEITPELYQYITDEAGDENRVIRADAFEKKDKLDGVIVNAGCNVIPRKVRYYHNELFYFDEDQEAAILVKPPAIIVGDPGSGKTAANLTMLREAVEAEVAEKGVFFSDSPGLYLRIKEDFRRDNPGLSEKAHSRIEFHNALSIVKAYWPDYSEDKQSYGFAEFCGFIKKAIQAEQSKQKNNDAFTGLEKIESLTSLYHEFQIIAVLPALKDYFSLGDRETNVKDPVIKKWVVSQYEVYQKLMRTHSAFDPTLLLWEVKEPTIDLLRGDEMQVASRNMQVMLLRLTKNNNVVYFCDPNQGNSHLSVIPYMRHLFRQQNLDVKQLNIPGSYRCPMHLKPMLDFFLLLQNTLRGGISSDRETIKEVKVKKTKFPESASVEWVSLKGKDQVVRLEEIKNELRAKNAVYVVIAEESQIEDARREFGDDVPVYTADQARGMEFDVVIIYNLFGVAPIGNQKPSITAASEVSQRLKHLKGELKLNEYKSKDSVGSEALVRYTKLIYAALSRAKNHCYLVQESHASLHDFHKRIKVSVEDGRLLLSGIDKTIKFGEQKEWEALANENIKNGNYEQARVIYKRLHKTEKELEEAIIASTAPNKSPHSSNLSSLKPEIKMDAQPELPVHKISLSDKPSDLSLGTASQAPVKTKAKPIKKKKNKKKGKLGIKGRVAPKARGAEHPESVSLMSIPKAAPKVEMDVSRSVGYPVEITHTPPGLNGDIANYIRSESNDLLLHAEMIAFVRTMQKIDDTRLLQQAIKEKICKFPDEIWLTMSATGSPFILMLISRDLHAEAFFRCLLDKKETQLQEKLLSLFSKVNFFDRSLKSLDTPYYLFMWMYETQARSLLMNCLIAKFNESEKYNFTMPSNLETSDLTHVLLYSVDGVRLSLFPYMAVKYPNALSQYLQSNPILGNAIAAGFFFEYLDEKKQWTCGLSQLLRLADSHVSTLKSVLGKNDAALLDILADHSHSPAYKNAAPEMKPLRWAMKNILETLADEYIALEIYKSNDFTYFISANSDEIWRWLSIKMVTGKTLFSELCYHQNKRAVLFNQMVNWFQQSDHAILGAIMKLFTADTFNQEVMLGEQHVPLICAIIDYQRLNQLLTMFTSVFGDAFVRLSGISHYFQVPKYSSRLNAVVPLSLLLAAYQPDYLLRIMKSDQTLYELTRLNLFSIYHGNKNRSISIFSVCTDRIEQKPSELSEAAFNIIDSLIMDKKYLVVLTVMAATLNTAEAYHQEMNGHTLFILERILMMGILPGTNLSLFCHTYGPEIYDNLSYKQLMKPASNKSNGLSLFYYLTCNENLLNMFFNKLKMMPGDEFIPFCQEFASAVVRPVSSTAVKGVSKNDALINLSGTRFGIEFLSKMLSFFGSLSTCIEAVCIKDSKLDFFQVVIDNVIKYPDLYPNFKSHFLANATLIKEFDRAEGRKGMLSPAGTLQMDGLTLFPSGNKKSQQDKRTSSITPKRPPN